MLAFSLKGDWNEVVTEAEEIPDSVYCLPSHFRALAELGRVAEMLNVAQNFPLAKGQKLPVLSKLLVFAFRGRVSAVEKMLAGPLSALASDDKRFWLATAKLVADEDTASAREDLMRLAETPIYRRSAERRLSSPSALLVWTGSPEEIELLDRWEARPSKAEWVAVAIGVASVVYFLATMQILVAGNQDTRNAIGTISVTVLVLWFLLTKAAYWTIRTSARLVKKQLTKHGITRLHDFLARVGNEDLELAIPHRAQVKYLP